MSTPPPEACAPRLAALGAKGFALITAGAVQLRRSWLESAAVEVT